MPTPQVTVDRWWHDHHRHHRKPKYFDITITTHTHFTTKDGPMSAAVTLVDGQSTVGTAGQTRDALGQATTDPLASGSVSWSVDNTLVAVTPSADTLSATFSVAAGTASGVVNVAATGTTVGGVAVTATAVLTVNAPPVGPPVTFDLTFSTPQ